MENKKLSLKINSITAQKNDDTIDQELSVIISRLEEVHAALQDNYLHDEARIVECHLAKIRDPKFKKQLAHSLPSSRLNPIHAVEGFVMDFNENLIGVA